MIAIIDYGAGNLHSVKNALDFLNAESIVTADLLKRLKLLQRAVNRFWEYVWDFI